MDGVGLLAVGEAEVLATVTKSRARGTSGRRPPSRAARRGAATAAVAEQGDVGGGAGDALPGGDGSPAEESPAVRRPFGGISMFGTGFNPATALKPKQVDSPDPTNKENDAVPEETTGGGGAADIVEKATRSVHDKQNIPVEEDELLKPEPPEMTAENEEEDEEDFFGLKVPAVNGEGKTSVQVDSDSEDDVFATITKPSKPTGVPPASGSETSKTTKNIFGFDDSDDDDDLFSNMASGVRPALRPDPMANILGDDSDEDLFSSLMSKSSQ